MEENSFFKWPLLSSSERWWFPNRRQRLWSFNGLLQKLVCQDQHRAVTLQEEVCSRRGMVKTIDQPWIKYTGFKDLKDHYITIRNINHISSWSKIKLKKHYCEIPLNSRYRKSSIRDDSSSILYFLDNYILGCNSWPEALTFLLENLGFIVHRDKSVFQQTQKLGFLGMMIDFITMKLQVPGENIKIRLEARSLLRPPTTTARGVYKCGENVGNVTSDSPYPTFLQILQRDLPTSLLEGQ